MNNLRNKTEKDLKDRKIIPSRATLHFASGEQSSTSLDDEYQPSDDRIVRFGEVLAKLATNEEESVHTESDVRL